MTAANRKVLIMEDAVFIRAMERRFLESAGYEIVGETNSEKECVELYKKFRPDLLIADLALAEGTGGGAIQSISEFDPGFQYIVVTSYADQISEEMRGKAQAVLIKPFSEAEFAAALKA
ncbi:MAG: response regulator [bacterium]|nr:response regulator [bacterium]